MMNDNAGKTAFELVAIIVDFGMGSKIMQKARKLGMPGGTICLGRGTVKNRILDFIGLNEIRKEIILMVAEEKTVERVMTELNNVFAFEKPNHGIAFTTAVCQIIGARSSTHCDDGGSVQGKDVNNPMYDIITVVVDKGKGESVIDEATKAGSTGGTIIKARGSGIHETSKVFNMDIEPEKEIVIIITEKEKTEDIVNSVRHGLKIDEPGKGIIFVQEVKKAFGLYNG
jgi:nitrogen regulatory protein PII